MATIQKLEGKNDKQVLHRTKLASTALLEQVRLANLIPPVATLLGYEELSEKVYEILEAGALAVGHSTLDVYRLSLFATIAGFLQTHLPPEKFPDLYEYLGAIAIDRAPRLYDEFRNVYGTRALLDALAGAQERKASVPGARIDIPGETSAIRLALGVDSTGKFEVKPGPLLDALVGVEADRIRRCSECSRIFWAGRIDKYACCRNCVNSRNVRLWRERYGVRYKPQRIRKADAAESVKVSSTRGPGSKSK